MWLKPWSCRSLSVLPWIFVASISVATVLAQSSDVAPRALDDGRQWIDLGAPRLSTHGLNRSLTVRAIKEWLKDGPVAMDRKVDPRDALPAGRTPRPNAAAQMNRG
jgi:hypothetical protein